MKSWKACWELFRTFFKIGLFTFGGGYAMISLIMSEVCEKHNWIDSKELTDVVAIAESTPGPIAINSATYIGYKRAGLMGSAAATLGVVLPSLCIIYAISLCVEWFMEFKAVQSAFKGIQVAVAILILRAGIRLTRDLPLKVLPVLCCAASLILVLLINFGLLGFSTIWLILAGGVVGLATLTAKAHDAKEDDGNA